ncbi:DUF6324 family protein [Paracoccus sp. TOH]|uniref:DUF6324 family protein n=1 Tax=Paracoccus simplex TaxID=2086346 RepID=A0ABV7RWG4_9RHOB|nr:DUF6324 family protein [Paracoccus sp. TOH]WJS85833.1 DUF6324 family protein [Paracoccus sp. TOH]
MSINSESNIAANLQIGPTDRGMVRIYVEAEGVDLPLDFDPDEAEEIAEELLAAAEAARSMGAPGKGGGGKPGKDVRKPRR